ncbi:MAG: hypothetical protein IT327_04990 [Anaerolineae bacterium]|nr:hypothetical protein [Anaerolineae bacterium]
MDALLNLETAELTRLVIIAVVLLVGLFLARLAFKLTASLMRIGCLAVFLIVAAIALMQMFGGA